jgi:ketosteroid isomerase-like protein
MKKVILGSMIFVVSAFFVASCGDSAGNASSKPANNAAVNTNTAPPVNPAAIEADIKKLVTDYTAALSKNDIAAYEKMMADSFTFVNTDGTVQTKTQRLDAMKSGATKYESLTYDDVTVRVNPDGNGATVLAKATVKGKNIGKPIDTTLNVTQVWSKMKDGWKMASLQATNPTAKTDDKPKMDDKAKADDKSKMEAKAKAADKAADE